MNWKNLVGYTFIGLGVLLAIISLATKGWLVPANDVDCHYGLVQYECHGSTYSIDNLPDDSYGYNQRLKEGGKEAIACGIVGIVCAAAGAVFLFLSKKQKKYYWQLLTLAAWIVAGSLAILAVILYSRKTVQLYYSFILYLFASFAALLGCCVILAGPGVTVVTK